MSSRINKKAKPSAYTGADRRKMSGYSLWFRPWNLLLVERPRTLSQSFRYRSSWMHAGTFWKSHRSDSPRLPAGGPPTSSSRTDTSPSSPVRNASMAAAAKMMRSYPTREHRARLDDRNPTYDPFYREVMRELRISKRKGWSLTETCSPGAVLKDADGFTFAHGPFLPIFHVISLGSTCTSG
ncbi:hypothetical protein A0H81_02942 [Grifola frondosa]|uniref:Uncharacterized protein n=1 Tax=Grifola frondosa TaxID=5627 RepID=A0A1C7MIR8_GRIFR|nr:hypothetical protein A0H81_02942 [Grifola frondosa]